MKQKKISLFIVIPILAIIVIFFERCNTTGVTPAQINTTSNAGTGANLTGSRGLTRNPARMHYSKHARCRMECRHITETEIAGILKSGTINYKKSELGGGDDCHKKYAVEGYSHEQQHLRVIFAPCNNEITVVTCIELGKEWPCHCETGY